MNKRNTILSIILFFIILFTINAKVSSDGCCFLNYTVFSLGCYDSSQADCTLDLGEFFDGTDCSDVEKCRAVCCCKAFPSQPSYPIRKGTCNEMFGGLPLSIGEVECDNTCSRVTPSIPLCNASCEPNTKDCVGRGRIVDIDVEGSYYCWENNKTYANQFLCTASVVDGGCPTIEQCTLGAEITSDCYCGGSLYSSGICCWSNKHDSAYPDGVCPGANECEKHLEMGSFFGCCDACEDPLQYWSSGDSYCVADYGIKRGLCCQECAPNLVDCCDYDWQCGTILSYSYSSCTGIACGESCVRPVCAPDQIINVANPSYPMCICAGEYVDTSTDSRYCCATGPQFSCVLETFNLKGYVYSINRTNKVANASIRIVTPIKEYTTTTDKNGNYLIGNIAIGVGKFTVLVLKQGYYRGSFEYFFTDFSPDITYTKDFNITPISGVCDEFNPPPVSIFDANPVKGKREVNLTWENPCPEPSKVVAYSIWRVSGHYLGTFFTANTSFIDKDVEWSDYSRTYSNLKRYTYYIQAHYISGRNSSEVFTSITMGHKYCEGIFGNEEFCLNSDETKLGDLTQRYKCDNLNDLTQEGLSTLLSMTTDCSPSFCVGPNKDGITGCKIDTNCKERGNPFGIFYTEEECLADDSYCYYDYSNTTIDICEDCDNVNDCYGYKSENACLNDNCLITGAYAYGEDPYKWNSGCEWSYTFEEFGKGICYDEDYIGTGYCGLCNEDSILFYNINCNQGLCTKLGSCYSDGLSCQNCSMTTKCEDFISEEACVNAHSGGVRNRDIIKTPVGCPLQIIESDDACGLGACKWGVPSVGSTPMCYKDADDNIPDCDLRKTIDVQCKEDFKPYNTKPQVDIPKINADGYGITLYLTERSPGDYAYNSYFYFCIDKNNSCCPTTMKNIQNPPDPFGDPYVVINPLEETNIITEVRTYFIRYYSVDSHKNVEEIKSTEFFVDPIYPKMSFDNYSYTDAGHNYTGILAVSDEYVNCNINLNGIPLEKISSTNFDLGYNLAFFMEFEDLDEGNYVLTVECEDSVGNSVRTNYQFGVDFVHSVGVGYPHQKILNTDRVRFYLTTRDDSICSLEAINASASGIPYNLLSSGMTQEMIIPNNLYNHTTAELILQKNVSYIVKATCTSVETGIVDTGFFHFTIDTQAPITTTDFDFSTWHAPDPDTGLVAIKFKCNDPKINGTPGEAGCAGVYLCTGLNCHGNENNYNLLLNDEYQTNIHGGYISYFSVDKIGNKEFRAVDGHYNQIIKIDGIIPTINIQNPRPQDRFTGTRGWDIVVSASDNIPSGVDYVEIRIDKVDPIRDVKVVNATNVPGTNLYRLDDITLFDGLNLITVTACDLASNCVISTHELYLDIYPPQIGDIIITDSDFDLDVNNIFEYGQILFFAVDIEDKYELRSGVGADPNKVKLTIYNNNNQFVTSAKMVSIGGNSYLQNITELLPVGKYNATVEAYDLFGNRDSKRVTFEINDTTVPILTLIPELPPVVYKQSYYITGITDPNLQVIVTVFNETWESPEYYSGRAGLLVVPKEQFKDKLMGDIVFNYQYPLRGDNKFIFKGDLSGVLFAGDYLEFSNHQKIPRYEITNRRVFSIGFNPVTEITISPPLEESVDSSIYTVSAFTSPYPSGWFNVPVNFKEGNNVVIVSAIDPGGNSIDIVRYVRMDTGEFDMILANPSDGAISYNDFVNAGNEIQLQIKTEKDFVDFRTSCKISHIGNDIIADKFRDIPMVTTDNIIHTFTINADSCKEKGGYYCLIGGASRYQLNYHHYMINCTSLEIEVEPGIEHICFTVATYGMQSGGKERGVNICQNSIGCSSLEPSPCPTAIDCNDAFHSSSQNNCILEGFCKWSIGYGCSETCYSGLVDDEDDGICTEPIINCPDYDGNRDMCMFQRGCKWCLSIATFNANKCLQNNCDNCGGLTYDSDPFDKECDDGGEGQGGWDD